MSSIVRGKEGKGTSMRPTTMDRLGIWRENVSRKISHQKLKSGQSTMLAGSPRFLSRFWSMKTMRAAKRACRIKGAAIAPCIAPLMKRKASGHLDFSLKKILHRHASSISTFLASVW